MGKINNKSKYSVDPNLSLDDYVIGSDAETITSGGAKTRNYVLSSIFSTFKTALNLASLDYKFSDGTDATLDENDAGYFTTNSNETSAPAVTAININERDLNGVDITSLLEVVDDQPTAFTLRLFKPSVVGQVFYFAISAITDNLDGTFTLTVSNFVGGNSLVDDTTYSLVFDLSGVPSIYTETDPVFTASPVGSVTGTQVTNWDTAFGWGDHASEGYLKSADIADFIALTDLSVSTAAAGTATLSYNNLTGVFTYTPPDLSSYLTTETDPVFSASPAAGITAPDIATWNLAYGWGDHAAAGYITTETDPVFTASDVFGVTTADINQWDSAYQWGDHAAAGYTGEVFVTGSTGASDSGKWVKVARIVLDSQYDNASAFLAYNNSTNGQEDARAGFFLLRAKQELALGNDPVVAVKSYFLDETSVDIGYVIVQNTPTSIVDFYVQPNNTFTTIHAYALSYDNLAKITWYSNEAYETSTPVGLTEVTTVAFLTDAPSDGTTYGRLNGAWAAVATTNLYNSNGSLTGARTVDLNGSELIFDNAGVGIYFNNGRIGAGDINPYFSGSQINATAELQTPEVATYTVNFKPDGTVQSDSIAPVAFFGTLVGGGTSDGYVFSTKNFHDDVLVWSIAGVGNATYGGVGREVEATIGLRNDFTGGQFTVLDMFNQDYDAATEVANSTGWVAIHGGGATAKEVGLWRYDTTTYTPIWELSPSNVWNFGSAVTVQVDGDNVLTVAGGTMTNNLSGGGFELRNWSRLDIKDSLFTDSQNITHKWDSADLYSVGLFGATHIHYSVSADEWRIDTNRILTENDSPDFVAVAGDTMTGTLTGTAIDMTGTIRGQVLIGDGGGDNIRVYGGSTGATNVGYLSFWESNGTTRQGYVGFGSSGNSSFYIRNDVSGTDLRLDEAGDLVYNDGTASRTVFHQGYTAFGSDSGPTFNATTGAWQAANTGAVGYQLNSSTDFGGRLPTTFGATWLFEGDADGRNFAFYKQNDSNQNFYVGLADNTGDITFRRVYLDGVDSFAQLGSTTANDDYLLINRSNASSPPFYVNQYGSGDIARFYNGASAGDTSGTAQVTITNNGDVQFTRDGVGVGEIIALSSAVIFGSDTGTNVLLRYNNLTKVTIGSGATIFEDDIIVKDNQIQVQGPSPRINFSETGETNDWSLLQDGGNISLRKDNGANERMKGSSDGQTWEFGTGGKVGLTVNDGGGNSNVTFNHADTVPDQNGNAGRIEVNTDVTTNASMIFGLKTNVTSGVGVTTVDVLTLTETGDATFVNDVVADDFVLSSDMRLKENIEDIEVREPSIQWRQFTMKKDGRFKMGVIAQELDQHFPEFVHEKDNGDLSVHYTSLFAHELARKDRQIEELEARLDRLEMIIKDML